MPGSYEPDPNGTPAQHELARYLELTRGHRDSWEEVYRGIDWFEDAARGLEGAPFRGDAILYPLENGRVGATERP